MNPYEWAQRIQSFEMALLGKLWVFKISKAIWAFKTM